MQANNQPRLFMASCISLLLTAMTFAIRARLETVFGPAGIGLTLEQIGYAFMPAFWGFTLAMILGGPLVDYIGLKKGMWAAFILHAIGIFLQMELSLRWTENYYWLPVEETSNWCKLYL